MSHTLHTTNPLPFQVRAVDKHRSSLKIHPEMVQMWPGHGDILILDPDPSRRIIKKPYTGSSSTSKTSENSLRILPYNGCQSTNLFRLFSKQFTDSSLQQMSICSDSSQLLKLVYKFSRHGRQFVACSDPWFRDVPKRGCPFDTCPLTIDIQFNILRWHL